MRRMMIAAVAAAGLLAQQGAARADDATGVWRLENGKVTVRVEPCGDGLCGTVVGLKKPVDDKGRPRLDKENPDPALRSRPVMGLTILSNMQAAGERTWSGTIYNPDDGRTYRSEMELKNSGKMKVNGCVMIFCKSMTFLRVE